MANNRMMRYLKQYIYWYYLQLQIFFRT